jgi:flavin-dependent dehydrogenase
MSKTFIGAVVVGNAIAAVLATWPDGISSAIAAGFLAGYALADRDPAA